MVHTTQFPNISKTEKTPTSPDLGGALGSSTSVYSKDLRVLDFTNSSIIDFKNTKIFSINFQKVDSADTTKRLPGAHFALYECTQLPNSGAAESAHDYCEGWNEKVHSRCTREVLMILDSCSSCKRRSSRPRVDMC